MISFTYVSALMHQRVDNALLVPNFSVDPTTMLHVCSETRMQSNDWVSTLEEQANAVAMLSGAASRLPA